MGSKQIRLSRIFNKNNKKKKNIIVPMDHGLSLGPIEGINDLEKLLKNIINTPVDSIILHKGAIKKYLSIISTSNVATIMHLSAGTDMINSVNKCIIGTVEEALSYGCDGVSVQVNFGSITENSMIENLGLISRECDNLGMPLMLMGYFRPDGKDFTNKKSIVSINRHIIRVAEEIGCDLVKINPIQNNEILFEILKDFTIPIFLAGGELMDSVDFREYIMNINNHNIQGISIGRNIFQRTDIQNFISEIRNILN